MIDPVTRKEQLLSAIATGGDIISPITREEMYLAYMAGDTSVALPEPITRKEQFLYQACLNGGGGGGTEITDGIVVNERDADGYATVVDFYGQQICIEQFGCQYEADNPFRHLVKVNAKQAVTAIGPRAFQNNVSLQTLTGVDFGAITSIGEGAFSNAKQVALGEVDLALVTKYPERGIFENCGGITKLTVHADGNIHYNLCNNCSSLTDIVIDGSVGFTDGNTDSGHAALGRNTALVNCKIGNVGKPCNGTSQAMLKGCTNANLIVEIYVAGENVDTAVSNIRNGATNATIIIKAAADTTYNGTTYAAGSTILTSTPEAST